MNKTSSIKSETSTIIEVLKKDGDCFLREITGVHGIPMVGFFKKSENGTHETLVRQAFLDEDGLSRCKHEHHLTDPRDVSKQFAFCSKCGCAVPFRFVKTVIPDFLTIHE